MRTRPVRAVLLFIVWLALLVWLFHAAGCSTANPC